MKTSIPIACGVSLFLLSFAMPADHVRFAVKEKTKLSKVFVDNTKFHSTSMGITVDGKDVDAGMDGIKVTIEDSSRVEVSDVYGELKDGKPSKLTRTYDKLSGKMAQHVELPEAAGHDPIDENKDRSSELEGKTVVFTLDDGGEYKPAFPDDKGDAALLKNLHEDMDLRGLLPDGEVEADKSWDIDVKAFNEVIGTPGGDLKLKDEGDKKDDSDFEDELRDNVKGNAKGTYKGTRDVDGHKCAVIELEGDLKTNGSRDEEESEDGPGGKMKMEIEYSLKGELLWDLEAGHFHSCKIEGDIKLKMVNEASIEHGGESHTMERTTEFEGSASYTAELGE